MEEKGVRGLASPRAILGAISGLSGSVLGSVWFLMPAIHVAILALFGCLRCARHVCGVQGRFLCTLSDV